MLQQYHTKLKGTLALTDSYLTEKALQKEKGLYKFIWVRQGSITVEIDHQEMVLSKDDVISLTHLQHLEFKSIDGEYMTLLFNSNFYCIYGNDHEVSCSGFLFNGSSHLVRFTLNEAERRQLDQITEAMENEFTVSDSLQEEMLRILLKRFIILLYSNKSAKEIADILGFEDQASFSRFFKNMTGQSAVQFRNTEVGKN